MSSYLLSLLNYNVYLLNVCKLRTRSIKIRILIENQPVFLVFLFSLQYKKKNINCTQGNQLPAHSIQKPCLVSVSGGEIIQRICVFLTQFVQELWVLVELRLMLQTLIS